jgi:serine phosphatase RsbU (regulator of sigma subunit)
VAAAYEPMTAVAGDFYELLPVDRHRAGFLVADVSGHGVPATLIASMIKVAAQSVAASAPDPAGLLLRPATRRPGTLRSCTGGRQRRGWCGSSRTGSCSASSSTPPTRLASLRSSRAENAAGEPFGDARLEQVLRDVASRPADELCAELLSAVTAWRPPPMARQDDVTLLVIEVVG